MKYTTDNYLDLIKMHKINSVYEFRKKFPAMYLYYTRHKATIGELPLIKLKRANNELTFEICAQIAKKYQFLSQFQNADKGAYNKARSMGWLKQICSHMTKKPFIGKGGRPGQPADNRIDLSGQTFGKWRVLSLYGKRPPQKQLFWNVQCECGSTSIVSGSNLRQGLSTKCTSCSNQISAPMLEIANYIKSLGEAVEVSYRKFGFEIDIYVPRLNWFIEYDGNYWHSSALRTTAASELARYKRFKQAGLSGMRIFEDQWLNRPNLVKSMIAHRLGHKSAVQVPALFSIEKVPSQYKEFCEQNHLDGYGRSLWAVVAKSEQGEILAFMGFRNYISGVYKGQQELSRFCTNSKYNCYGYFGKMLKLAKKHIREQKMATYIVSASDNCISDGKVYKHNGFIQHGKDSRNWYYYLHSKGLRMHRANGKKLKPPKISQEDYQQYPTESAQATSGFMAYRKWGKWEPLYKIWGWGQKLWISRI